MHRPQLQKALALAAPVFDPGIQIQPCFFWTVERGITAGMTCNIGME